MQQGKFLGALYPALQEHYAEFHTFFRKLGVSTELSVSALVQALPQLGRAALSPEERIVEAMRIYTRASRDIVSPDGERLRPSWLEEFTSGRSFLTTRDTMVTCDGHLFVDDKPAIAALFRDSESIRFVAVPPARLPQVRDLLVAAEVPVLSTKVFLRLENPGQGRPNAVLSRRLRERHGLIARLVYSNSHAAFSRAVEAGKWTTLAALFVAEVDNLVLRAELLGEVATMTGDVVIDGTTAYTRTGVKGVVDRLAVEICALLAVAPSLADGVSRILSESELAGAEEFLEVKGVTELPDDEHETLFAGAVSTKPPTGVETHEQDESAASQPETSGIGGTAFSASSPVPRSCGASTGAQAGTAAAPPGRESSGQDSAQGGHDTGAFRSVNPIWATVSLGAGKSPRSGSGPGASTRGSMHFSPIAPGLALQLKLRRLAAGHARARGKEGDRRLISYVEPIDCTSSPGTTDADALEAHALVERAAVKFFIDSQAPNWSSLEEMPSHNQGFDIKGVSLDGRQHYIEVKGQSGAWTAAGITMTPSEVLCAAQHRDLYWLCVVEYALDENRRHIYTVKNPFGNVGQFRYDSGWKDVAVSERSAALVPAEGLRIKIDDVGSGEIVSVIKIGGIFSRIQVRLDDATEIVRVFNPAKMQLSKAK